MTDYLRYLLVVPSMKWMEDRLQIYHAGRDYSCAISDDGVFEDDADIFGFTPEVLSSVNNPKKILCEIVLPPGY